MITAEPIAKQKFCPLGRGAFPTGQGHMARLASGVNMAPAGPLTHCEGSLCMLWETAHAQQVELPIDCPDCQGKKDKIQECEKCEGKGEIMAPREILHGFCGAGFQGPLAVHVERLAQAVTKAAQDLKPAPWWRRLFGRG